MYIAITSRAYASRFIYSESGAKGILTALQKEVVDRAADASLTAGPNGLNGKLGPVLKMLCQEFNDLKSLDKVASVQAKVDAVTVTMKENVALAMRNNDRCVVRGGWKKAGARPAPSFDQRRAWACARARARATCSAGAHSLHYTPARPTLHPPQHRGH